MSLETTDVPSVARLLGRGNHSSRHQYFGAPVCYALLFGTTEMLTPVLTVGSQLRYCGVGYGYDDIKVDGNPADLKVRPFPLLAGTDSKQVSSLSRTTSRETRSLQLQVCSAIPL
jgi:hypothetical protein